MPVNAHSVHPRQAVLMLASAGGARGPIRSGRAAQALRRWLVLARWRIARDEFFASDDDFWLFEQLHFVIFLLVHISMGLFVYRVTSVHQLYVFVRLVE